MAIRICMRVPMYTYTRFQKRCNLKISIKRYIHMLLKGMYVSKAFSFFVKKMMDDAGIFDIDGTIPFLLLRHGHTKTLEIFTAATVLPFR